MQLLNTSAELKLKVFKLVEKPISLILTDREWYNISQDPQARAEWLIYKYGKTHAFFHAVRLGNNFISENVIRHLLLKSAIISRYFLQRLLLNFGTCDEQLKSQRVMHNQTDPNRNSTFQNSPWASNLSLPNFTKLLTEGSNNLQMSNDELAVRGNDMELFQFLSANPLAINDASYKLRQNLNEIKDLIINKKFIPFPPRPKLNYEDTIEYKRLMQTRCQNVEFPSKDGYENVKQFNAIARAILIHPDLVILWKTIGYKDICNDVNELVMKEALLILFPPNQPNDWECPSLNSVNERLGQLINLGFKLTDTVMEEVLCSLEHRLNEIGDVLLNSFRIIHQKSISDIAYSCLIEAIKPEMKLENFDLLEYLIDKIDQPELYLMNLIKYYNIGFKFNFNSIELVKKIRSLSVHSNFYYWVLKKFGPNSEITQKCFEDIIESRIWIDLKLQETPERIVPEKFTESAFNSICSIYLEFCNENVKFKKDYLSYLSLARNEEIIKPFFGINLPMLFGLKLKYEIPFENNYQYDRPKINFKKNDDNEMMINDNDNQTNKNEMREWLEQMHFGPIHASNSNITENFRSNFGEFWESMTTSLQMQ